MNHWLITEMEVVPNVLFCCALHAHKCNLRCYSLLSSKIKGNPYLGVLSSAAHRNRDG